jgi:membrane-associated protease RseP (regulator of RpoE activity)
MFNWKTILLIPLIGLLIGCAGPTTQRREINDALVEIEARKQRAIAFETLLNDQKHLTSVAYPLLRSAVSFCEGQTKPSLGLIYANKHAFADDLQDTAITTLGVGEPLQVIQATPTSPVALAGLESGDILIAINGKNIPTGKDAAKNFSDLLDEELSIGQPVRISVVRNGQQHHFEMSPVAICHYPAILVQGDAVNAYADGNQVVITKGMLRFVESDNELAMVIAHELAHNAMKHQKAKMQNYVLGSLLDILAAAYGINTQGTFGNSAAQAYSQEFEAEADYVGLYIMALASLEIENSANFWRRMAALHPASIGRNHASSHPATAERFVAIEQTVIEIRQKQAGGLALTPEYQDSAKARSQQSDTPSH